MFFLLDVCHILQCIVTTKLFSQALLNMGEAEYAEKDFQICLDLDQNNKAAKQQLQRCGLQIKADKRKEKQLYGGMFDKFARQDRAVRLLWVSTCRTA